MRRKQQRVIHSTAVQEVEEPREAKVLLLLQLLVTCRTFPPWPQTFGGIDGAQVVLKDFRALTVDARHVQLWLFKLSDWSRSERVMENRLFELKAEMKLMHIFFKKHSEKVVGLESWAVGIFVWAVCTFHVCACVCVCAWRRSHTTLSAAG